MAKPLPDISVPVLDKNGRMHLEWYRYFQLREKIGLADLPDVKISTIADSQVIAWNATDKKYENVAVSLSGLADVLIASLANGQVLIWNTTASKWENGAN